MKTKRFLLIVVITMAIIITLLVAGMVFSKGKTIEIYLNNENTHCYYASKIN